MISRQARWLVAAGMLSAAVVRSQPAQVTGSVRDPQGGGLPGATVTARHSTRGFSASAQTNSDGLYSFVSLPLGIYGFRAEAGGFLALERQGIELSVGDKRSLDFVLTPPAGPGGSGQVEALLASIPQSPLLPVETLAASVSVVVEESKILQLPLASRNIYSLFLLQPGVTSQRAIEGRGLSFSVHGQRVSGSNYLLDGVDNNNTILTGPVAAASAEAIQEFRMVNSSFSAEYGRATAFVAQVVTRSGDNRFGGGLFEYLGNDRLNANTLQNNTAGRDRASLDQNQFGGSMRGPLRTNRTFFSGVAEISRLRYTTPVDVKVPTQSFAAGLPVESTAARLLREIPPRPGVPSGAEVSVGNFRGEAPNGIDTLQATERLDHLAGGGRDRLLLRHTLTSTQLERQSASSSGYPSLLPTDRFRAQNTLAGWTRSLGPGRVQELRLGWSRERMALPRPRSDVPVLPPAAGVLLPSSLRLRDRRENNNVLQVSDLFSLQQGRSSWRAGFEFRRNLSNRISTGLEDEALGGAGWFINGFYQFADLRSFSAGRPLAFSIIVDRQSSGRLRLPDLARRYRSGEYAAFLQNDLRVTRRLSFNLGLRYEYSGIPANHDRSVDINYYFGPGSSIEERFAAGGFRATPENPGDLAGRLYRPDYRDLAPSMGLAWDPLGRGRTVVRLGYAVAVDRVFDSLRDLTANNQTTVNCFTPPCTTTFLAPAEAMLSLLPQTAPRGAAVQLDEGLRSPYAQNWFAGFQHALAPSLLLEAGHAGSVGRKLISRDGVNRSVGNLRSNPRFGATTFLSNAGNSNYLALEASLRRRFSRGLQLQVSYTYSHAIDNQSDTLEGTRAGPQPGEVFVAGFTRPYDARVDRGNANFDQRHNLVFNLIWDLPVSRWPASWTGRLVGRWTMGLIGGRHSGFPVTVIGSAQQAAPSGLYGNRADYLGGSPRPAAGPQVAGGVAWLDPGRFRNARDQVGSLGRGALPGPGFWNYDFALLRSFAAGERLRAQFRAEFYNLFNHANLSAPVAVLDRPDFGRAYYGLNRPFSRFGELPLESSSRRIQLGLRIQF